MPRFLLLALLMMGLCTQAWAQRLDGKWEGELTQEEGGLTYRYGFRMNLTVQGGVVTGNSEVWLPDSPDNFSRMRIQGTLRGAMLSFEEQVITDSRLVPMWEWCMKQGDLMMDTSGTEWVLHGAWHGTALTPKCAPGMVTVKRLSPPRPAPPKVDTVAVSKPADPVVQLGEDKMPSQIEDRRVTRQRTATVATPKVEIYVWDSDEIDGDIISLNFNGEWILKDHKLGRKRTMLTLELKPDVHNYLILYAKNEGRIPPNTAAVSWIQNGKYVTTSMMSDDKNCGAIQFKLK